MRPKGKERGSHVEQSNALNLCRRTLQDDFDRLAARTIRVVGSDRIYQLDHNQIGRLNAALGKIQLGKSAPEMVTDRELIGAFDAVVDEGSMTRCAKLPFHGKGRTLHVT